MSTSTPEPTHSGSPLPTASGTRRKQWWRIGILVVALVAALSFYNVRTTRLNARLILETSSQLATQPNLIAYASRRAAPLYQEHCASCHGADMKGSRTRGVPDLQDSVWLYGSGTINDIEQTILYGIRSGHPKARNLTDMPGFGRTGQLNNNDINDVVEYVLKISSQQYDAPAAQRGSEVFQNRGLCYDCHASDGYGVSDYGTPGLVGRGGSWLYGGDRASLHKSVFDGRHGLCPNWVKKLSFVDIRSLAVYLYAVSHRNESPNSAANGSQANASTSAASPN